MKLEDYIDFQKGISKIKVTERITIEREIEVESQRIPEVFLDKIICIDALEGLKQLPSNCVDLVLTDPPFNIAYGWSYKRENTTPVNMDFGEWDYFGDRGKGIKEGNQQSDELYLKFTYAWIDLATKCLKQTGNFGG